MVVLFYPTADCGRSWQLVHFVVNNDDTEQHPGNVNLIQASDFVCFLSLGSHLLRPVKQKAVIRHFLARHNTALSQPVTTSGEHLFCGVSGLDLTRRPAGQIGAKENPDTAGTVSGLARAIPAHTESLLHVTLSSLWVT
jgi:hypothetical protein